MRSNYKKFTGIPVDMSRINKYLQTVEKAKSDVGEVFDERGQIYTEVYLDTDQNPHQPIGHSVVRGGGGRLAGGKEKFSGGEVRVGAQTLVEGSAEWHRAVTILQMLDWARSLAIDNKHKIPTKQSVPLNEICYEGFVYREDEGETEKRYVVFHCYPQR
jgi:hypothetical protein